MTQHHLPTIAKSREQYVKAWRHERRAFRAVLIARIGCSARDFPKCSKCTFSECAICFYAADGNFWSYPSTLERLDGVEYEQSIAARCAPETE